MEFGAKGKVIAVPAALASVLMGINDVELVLAA
jgi:hypothetical protein